MPEAELRQLLHEHGFTISHMSYRQNDKGAVFEYRMVIGTTDQDTLRNLATSLRKMRNLLSFASLRRATRRRATPDDGCGLENPGDNHREEGE